MYFSPDHSIGVETRVIEEAEQFVHIATPGWDSWSGCTSFNPSPTSGCGVAFQRNSEVWLVLWVEHSSNWRYQAFPIFHAVLNAIHRGVTVRILTNNYNEGPGQGTIYY